MSSILRYLILLILLNNCSLDTKTGIWSDKKDLILLEDVNSTKIFTKDEPLEKEFNPNLQIKLTSKLIENSFVNNLTNNNGRINYEGKLKKYQSLNSQK